MYGFSVLDIPGANVSAAFIRSGVVFRESSVVPPVKIADGMEYIPWGADNLLPFRIIDEFESDETLSACSAFTSEVTYASGIRYDAPPEAHFSREIKDFFLANDMPDYFLGACRDIKMFEFAVSVLVLSRDGRKITGIFRKPACYCRFAPSLPDGSIPYVLFANWRFNVSEDTVEKIPVLDSRRLLADLHDRAAAGQRIFAVVSKIPSADSLYYPIPAYASIFRGKWYNIKRFIGIAKEAKLKNSAPLKYLIEISDRYWEELFRAKHITDHNAKAEEVIRAKQEMIDFLTGAENSGKALFSNFRTTPDGKEAHDIRITKIENDKEGGDWASDHAEAINMICFAMRVHSNLVGSVPGKAQTNNSGSDKRELYTIAQALQLPYRECLYSIHRVICAFNGWENVRVHCPLLQLTTLDKHTDAKEVNLP